jgi:hypothetical protein
VLAARTRLLARLIEENEIDLVGQIDATPAKYGLPAVHLAKRYGLPSVVTLCSQPGDGYFSNLHRGEPRGDTAVHS